MADFDFDEFEIPVLDAGGAVRQIKFGGKPAPSVLPAKNLPEPVPEERLVAAKLAPATPKIKTPEPEPLPPVRPKALVEQRQRQQNVYERIADDILRVAGVRIGAETAGRLRTALIARLKDIRDGLETREMLVRPVAQGGVGLAASDADRLSAIVEERCTALENEFLVQEKQKTVAAMKRESEESAVRRRGADTREAAAREALIASLRSAPGRVKPAAPIPRSEPVAAPPARPRVRDVAAPGSELVGPVEELRRITLVDFRRLSRDPREAALRIRDKIFLLGEESFPRRFEGLRAWQSSEVSRLYTEVIAASMTAKKSVRDLLAEPRADAQPGLTISEFNAIMELNELLRYA